MQPHVHPRYIPVPYQEAPEAGRLILKDGTTAHVRLAGPKDAEALRAFFERLSPESRRHRFFSASLPRLELVTALCDSSNPHSALTLIVTRTYGGEDRVFATGSYLSKKGQTAEIAFAVDDSFQGKGLGTLLLERLALLAVRHGFNRFWAVTHADNKAMRGVFQDSGFDVQEHPEGSEIDVDLSVLPTETSVARLETRDRIATTASLRPFFCPKSVTLIGASRDPASIGYRILEALTVNRFQGPVYPVNPKAQEVGGLKAYPTVRDLPEPVDLAVIAVPRDAVLGVVDDCAVRGVRALLVITAGFAEVNEAGRELQTKLVNKARGYGMRVIGPNCLGLLNTEPAVRLNASFSSIFPPSGRVAMSSQSGALGLAVLGAASRLNLGLSTFVSVGNKADVSGNDLLQYWEEDAGTQVILLYLESLGNPRRFARIARRVSERKPIVAIKSGRTKAGGRAAGSHTAALAASETAVDALFRQTGVIRADTLEEMFDLAAFLGSQPLPRGRRVGIVTNAGGPAILCTDMAEAGGLVIPELSPQLKEQLAAFLPAAASVGNPVDMIASATPQQYGQVVQTLLMSDAVDALIVIYIPVGQNQKAAVVAAMGEALRAALAAGAAAKPLLACLMTEEGGHTRFDQALNQIPSYPFPEAPARVLSRAVAYSAWRDQPSGVVPSFDDFDLNSPREICLKALSRHGAGWLSAEETWSVLQAARLPVIPARLAATVEKAVELAREVGFPVATKLASRRLVHKSEIGGVRLNLTDADAVRQAFGEIRDSVSRDNQLDAMDGVVVQPMVSGGVEVMVGVIQDPLFGPLVAFGLGGIHVEILADVCFRITPLTDRDAAEMVRSIRGYRLLQGYRGHPAADIESIEEILLRVSQMVEEIPEIGELDLNPIFAMPPGEGCRIADARILVRTHPWSAGEVDPIL